MPLDNKNKREVASKAVSEMLKMHGIKMHDAGYTPPKPKKLDMAVCGPYGGGPSFPSMYLNANNAPEMKGYEAGDEVLLLVKGKITSHSLSERKDNRSENWDLQITELACLNKKE